MIMTAKSAMSDTYGEGPSVVSLFERHAERTPNAQCLTHDGVTRTFAEVDESANRLANVLIECGVVAGDRVALLSHTSPIFYELTLACGKIGAIAMLLNSRLSEREIVQILENGEPRIILAAPEFVNSIANAHTNAHARTIGLNGELAALLAGANHARPTPRENLDDATLLLYTSGTTGRPKGVMISHRNLAFIEPMAREIWSATRESVNLVILPLYHIGGIGYGLMTLSQGGHTVLSSKADPASVLSLMREHGVTHSLLVPTIVQNLVNAVEAGEEPPKTVEKVIYGASIMPTPLLVRAMELFGCGFINSYGMTETSGTVTSLSEADHELVGPGARKLKSCGRALPWVELRLVVPETGAIANIDEVGEIQVRTRMNMQGYWRNPEETAKTLSPEGWLRTGDAAAMDESGNVYIKGRYKDMIISGGENIYPAEIENVLHEHEDVEEAVVVGAPHEKWGETPKAFVKLKDGARLAEAELREFLSGRLARYKRPSSIVFVDDFPRNVSGKVVRRNLQESVKS